MTVQELIKKSIESYEKGRAIVTHAENEKKELTADQRAEAHKLFDEGDAFKKQADEQKRIEDADKAIVELKAPNYLRPRGGDDEEIARKAIEAARLGNGGGITTALNPSDPRFKYLRPAVTVESKAAFEAYIRFATNGNLHALSDIERKALSPLTDPEGGMLLTDEYRTEIIRKLRNAVHIRQRARVITTAAAQVSFPTFDPQDSQTTLPQAQPNAAIGAANLTNIFGKVTFTPHKRATIVQIPLELIEDAAVDVTSLITDFFGSIRLPEIEEVDFISGTGVNQPVGLITAMKSKGLPTLAIAGATTAMVPEDIVKTVYGIREVYRRGASFLLHRLVIQAVRLFRTNIGGAGTGSFMFQPSVQAGEPATLFGYPILESEFFTNPYAGAAGDAMMMFGDLSYYWIVDRIDMMLQRLNELYAANDQVGFRLRVRYDGAPVLAEPFLFLTRN